MLQNSFFRAALGTVLVLTIIYLLHEVRFIFNPIVTFVSLLIVPVTISVFLYYLLRPVIHYLDRKRLRRTFSVLLMYLVILGLLTLFFIVVWPPLRNQIQQFLTNVPHLMKGLSQQFAEVQKSKYFAFISSNNSEISSKITQYINQGFEMASSYVSHFFSFISDFFIVVGTVPIILYYLLKEDGKISPALLRLVPLKYKKDGRQVVEEVDDALSGFIAGRIISSFILCLFSFIGYLIIGLPYPLMLAVVCAIFNFIPYFGSLLGAIPCVIVAFTESMSMVVWVIVVIFVAQQIEGNLISPYIYRKTINIHPLTTVVLILIAGDIGGILGMLLVIPLYMMVKILVSRLYEIMLMNRFESKS